MCRATAVPKVPMTDQGMSQMCRCAEGVDAMIDITMQSILCINTPNNASKRA